MSSLSSIALTSHDKHAIGQFVLALAAQVALTNRLQAVALPAVLHNNGAGHTAIRPFGKILRIAGQGIDHIGDFLAAAVTFIGHFLHRSDHPPFVSEARQRHGAASLFVRRLHRRCDTSPGQHPAIS